MYPRAIARLHSTGTKGIKSAVDLNLQGNAIGEAAVQARPRLDSAWFQKFNLMKRNVVFNLEPGF